MGMRGGRRRRRERRAGVRQRLPLSLPPWGESVRLPLGRLKTSSPEPVAAALPFPSDPPSLPLGRPDGEAGQSARLLSRWKLLGWTLPRPLIPRG